MCSAALAVCCASWKRGNSSRIEARMSAEIAGASSGVASRMGGR